MSLFGQTPEEELPYVSDEEREEIEVDDSVESYKLPPQALFSSKRSTLTKTIEDAKREFIDAITNATNQTKEKEKKLEEREEALNERERKIDDLFTRIEDDAEAAKELVKLNVGGVYFCTTKKTLIQFPDTYFAAMLSSSKWAPREEDNAYFIDRDPVFFGRILSAMRSGRMNTAGLNHEDIEALKVELDFFLLPQSVYPREREGLLQTSSSSSIFGSSFGHSSTPAFRSSTTSVFSSTGIGSDSCFSSSSTPSFGASIFGRNETK